MNITQLKRVRRLFFHDMVEPSTARHNARQWVKSVRFLGDKWLLVKKVERVK